MVSLSAMSFYITNGLDIIYDNDIFLSKHAHNWQKVSNNTLISVNLLSFDF